MTIDLILGENAMKSLFAILVLGLGVAFAQGAFAAGQGTPDEAKAMALRAADYLKVNGPEKSWVAFNASGGDFHDRDLYVFVVDTKCNVLAHGALPALIGKNICDLKDIDGKTFAKEMSEVKDQAWVDYKWLNPTTKSVEPKATYSVRVGDAILGVGAYK
jgi:cytochrome c